MVECPGLRAGMHRSYRNSHGGSLSLPAEQFHHPAMSAAGEAGGSQAGAGRLRRTSPAPRPHQLKGSTRRHPRRPQSGGENVCQRIGRGCIRGGKRQRRDQGFAVSGGSREGNERPRKNRRGIEARLPHAARRASTRQRVAVMRRTHPTTDESLYLIKRSIVSAAMASNPSNRGSVP